MAGGIASLMPRTVRLNNPGGLIQSPVQWAGMAQEQPDSRFVAFETPEAGLQAMAKNIRSYRNRHGLNTVEDIISRWAPPHENNTPAYIARVAQSLGVSPTEPLNLDDPSVMAGLMRAIARHEAGTDHYSEEMIRAALGGTPAPRPGPIPEAAPGEKPDYTHRDNVVRELQEFQRSAPPMLPPRPGAGIASLAQPQAAPPRAGIASLLQPSSPYMQLANQIAPARQADPWSTLGQIGAAMAASRSPTFLGGLAEGMGHGSQYVDTIGRENDALDRSRYEIAMRMAQADAKSGDEYAASDGRIYNKRTGAVVSEKPEQNKAPTTRTVKRNGVEVAEEYVDGKWQVVAENKIGSDSQTEIEKLIRMAGLDPQSAEGRTYALRALESKFPEQVRVGFKDENALRDEYLNLTKDFRVVQDSYNKIQENIASKTGAGDMAMLYGFVRMLDPGSVVRESEFSAAAASGSFGERVQGAVNRILNGERLPDSLRADFAREAENIYKSQLRGAESIKTTYSGLAKRYGLNPDNVTVEIVTPPQAATKPPAAPKAEKPAPIPDRPQVAPSAAESAPSPGAPLGGSPAADIPTFQTPDDPGFKSLPIGSVFRTPSGELRIKDR